MQESLLGPVQESTKISKGISSNIIVVMFFVVAQGGTA